MGCPYLYAGLADTSVRSRRQPGFLRSRHVLECPEKWYGKHRYEP